MRGWTFSLDYSFAYLFVSQLTETVASQFERCDEAPFFRSLQKSSTSRDSVSEVPSGEGAGSLVRKGTVKQESSSKEDAKTEEEASRKESKDERKESREERREAKEERKEKGDSLPRGMESGELCHIFQFGFSCLRSIYREWQIHLNFIK